MELKQLFRDDDAVAPVIGVILMVAITVILAAVIASFVLGMGQDAAQSNPQASFTFDYDESSSDQGYLTISHDGGDTIEAQELYVRGTGFQSSPDDSTEVDLTDAGAWSDDDGDGPNDYGTTSEITSGNRIVVSVNSDYEIDLVWEPQEKDTSATLVSNDGPDA
jgi:FlaG/FlaF family flagellin (archaellin)